MCICFIYNSNNPKAKIRTIILFNREEYLDRKAEGLGFHPIDGEEQNILFYPLDVPTQGTYFCLNTKNGNFSFLLNNPFLKNQYNSLCRLKRGSLPLEFCKLDDEEVSWNVFFEKLNREKQEYNGFNLVCGNFKYGKIKYFTNNIEDIKFNLEMSDNDLVVNKNINNKPFENTSTCNGIKDNLYLKKKINPISMEEYENFDPNNPFVFGFHKIYSISNTFLFDGVARCDYGGNLLMTIIKAHNKNFNFFEEKEENCWKEKNNDLCLIKNNEEELLNYENSLKKLIADIFELLQNDKRLQDNETECLEILKNDTNFKNNGILESFHSSSIFIHDKIADFNLEFGTRNSIALLYDSNDSLKIIYYEDKLKNENNFLTNEKRDLEKNILIKEFRI